MMMISLIVTAFEQLDTLTLLFERLAAQDYRGRWELILCDDGSRCEALPLVRQLARSGVAEARYIWQPDAGFRAAASRNNGIRVARGDLLVFLDGDMIVAPDFLSRHAALHDGSKVVVGGTRRTIEVADFDEFSELADAVRTGESDLPPAADEEASQQLGCYHSSTPYLAILSCNFSVPRRPEVAFDENFVGWGSEDKELAFRLVHRHGYRVCFTSGAEALHARFSTGRNVFNPLATCKHDDIVGLIRGKLHFLDLYPDADVSPAVQLLLQCHLDPATDRWFIAPARADRKLADVVAVARCWMERHGGGLPRE